MNELKNYDASEELAHVEATGKRFMIASQISNAMCQASLLPDHLRTVRKGGKITELTHEQIQANCLLIASQALRWDIDPFAILPSTFVVGGKLGFDGKLCAAVVNTKGGLSKKLSYEFTGKGDALTVTVSGTLEGENEPRTVELCVKDAKTDNQMWKKDPMQKLAYSGATRWARRHVPQVLLGITVEGEADATVIDADAAPTKAPKRLKPVPVAEAATDPELDEIPQPHSEEWVGPSPTEMQQRYLGELEMAGSSDEIKAIGERVRSDAALSQDMRDDLIAVATHAYHESRSAESAGALSE